MPNNKTKKLTYGAMMIAIFAVLMAISFYVPLVSYFTMLVAPLPIAYYSSTYDRTSSIYMAILGCSITFLFGGIMILPLSFIFAATGFIIGDSIRTKRSKTYIFMATSITILITFAIQYIVLKWFFEIDFIKQSLTLMRETYETSIELTKRMTGQTPITNEMLDYLFQTIELAMPSIITLGVFLMSFIIISVNLPLLKTFKIQVPKFNALKNLRLPKSILWYYLLILCINLFARPEFGSTLYMITFNISVVLWVLLTIQGLSFIYFCIEEYKLPNVLKGIATFMAIPLYSFVLLIGILDLGFNIRAYVTKKIQR